MKQYILLILTLMIAISCKEKIEEPNLDKEPMTIKKIKDDSISTIIGKVSPNDLSCISNIKEAKWDLKNNRLTYYVFKEQITYGRYAEEFEKLLKPLGVNCQKLSGIGNCIPLINSRQNCYYDYMNAGIKDKFRKGLIDSLERQAMKIYAEKNIDNVLVFVNDFLETKFYPKSKTYKTQDEDIKKDFLKNFVYPENFNKGDLWQANVSLIIYRNGNIEVHSNIIFNYEKNEPFTEYFKSKIEDFIMKINWIPYQLDGITLDSEVFFKLTANP